MAEHPTMHAVVVRGQDQPAAVFADADEAARYGRDRHGDRAVVVPVQGGDLRAAVRDGHAALPAEAPAPAAEPGTTDDPDAALRGRIRAELTEQRRRERITKEVEADLDREEREARPDQRQVPRTPAARPERA